MQTLLYEFIWDLFMKAVWLYTSWTSCAILEQWNGPIKTIMIQTVCDCPGQGSGSGRGHCDFEVAGAPAEPCRISTCSCESEGGTCCLLRSYKKKKRKTWEFVCFFKPLNNKNIIINIWEYCCLQKMVITYPVEINPWWRMIILLYLFAYGTTFKASAPFYRSQNVFSTTYNRKKWHALPLKSPIQVYFGIILASVMVHFIWFGL